MSTMCNHLLQCLKLTQKMEKGKLVHLAGIRGNEYGAKDCKVLKVQQTCSWVINYSGEPT